MIRPKHCPHATPPSPPTTLPPQIKTTAKDLKTFRPKPLIKIKINSAGMATL